MATKKKASEDAKTDKPTPEAKKATKTAEAQAKKDAAKAEREAKARAKANVHVDAIAKAPEGSLGHELAQLPDPGQEGFEAYTAGLVAQSNTTQVHTNLVRLKIGLYLLVNRPKHGNVAEWRKAEAERLGIGDSMLRTILNAARAIQRNLTTELSKPAQVVLNRPLTDIKRAVDAVINGRDPDAGKPKAEPKTAVEAVKSSTSAILAKFTKATDADKKAILANVEALLAMLKA